MNSMQMENIFALSMEKKNKIGFSYHSCIWVGFIKISLCVCDNYLNTYTLFLTLISQIYAFHYNSTLKRYNIKCILITFLCIWGIFYMSGIIIMVKIKKI